MKAELAIMYEAECIWKAALKHGNVRDAEAMMTALYYVASLTDGFKSENFETIVSHKDALRKACKLDGAERAEYLTSLRIGGEQ